MNVVAYCRFSSHTQNETSIEAQLAAIESYTEQHDYIIVSQYIDRAATGTSISQRHQFQQMIADSKDKKFEAVLIYDTSRFSRSVHDSVVYRKILADNGVRVISVTENLNEDSSAEKLMLGITQVISEHYSNQLSERVKRGQSLAAEKCQHLGGRVLLGYRVGEDKRYEIDPVTSPIVKRIFKLFVASRSEVEICEELNKLGLKTGSGNPFTKNSLQNILRNRRYLGIYTYKDTEIEGGMPRIISDEVFEEAQVRIKKQRNAPRTKRSYLLTSTLYCKFCDEWLVGTGSTGRHGKWYKSYSCKNAINKNKKCDVKFINGDLLEEVVIEACKSVLTDKVISDIAKAVSALSEKMADSPYIAQLKKEIAKTEVAIENLLLQIEGGHATDTISARLQSREEELQNLKTQLNKEEASIMILTEPTIRSFLSKMRKSSISSKKYREALVGVFVNKIYLDGNELTVFFNTSEKEPVKITQELQNEVKAQAEGGSNKPVMAEVQGFEPWVPLLTAHTISNRAPSASSGTPPQMRA